MVADCYIGICVYVCIYVLYIYISICVYVHYIHIYMYLRVNPGFTGDTNVRSLKTDSFNSTKQCPKNLQEVDLRFGSHLPCPVEGHPGWRPHYYPV